MPETKERNTHQRRRRVRDALFIPNLLLIVALGVAGCGWALAYTDWFPTIGGMLALGGALSWVAFISGILRDERKAQVQELLERLVLDSPVTTIVVLLLFAAGVILALGTASVSISSIQDTPALVTWYAHATGDAGDTLDVLPRTPQRWPVWVGYGGRARQVKLQVQGLPDLVFDVGASKRREVTIPYSFLRPVLLVRPSPLFIDLYSAAEGATLRVEVGDTRREIQDYQGGAVWIGCSEDVEIPRRIRDAWSAEVIDRGAATVRARWTTPMALPGARFDLAVGQRVKVSFVLRNGRRISAAVYTVRRVARLDDFPQMEVLDVPDVP